MNVTDKQTFRQDYYGNTALYTMVHRAVINVVNAGHVMISYDHSTQRTVLQIRDRLKSEGFKYWIDVEHMCTYLVFTSDC